MRLWSGISNSPLSGAQAGYGVGALLAVFLSKSFVKFNPATMISETNATLANQSTILKSSDITLQIPYSLAGLCAFLIFIAFLFAQYFETKNSNKFNRDIKGAMEENEGLNIKRLNSNKINRLNKLSFLIFNDSNYTAKVFNAKLLLTVFSFMLAISIGAFSIVFGNFLLTYTTKGPAKLSLQSYFTIQKMFWVFSVTGRLVASIVAFKINTLVYFLLLIFSNLVCIFFYMIPYFNSIPKFYWIIIVPLSTFNGPLIPSAIMVFEYVLQHLSSMFIAVFAIGAAIGAISAQYITSFLLDEFKPDANWFFYNDATSAYIIPTIIFFTISICFLIYLLLLIVFKFLKPRLDLSKLTGAM